MNTETTEKGRSYIPQITAAYEAMVMAEHSSLNEKIKLGELLKAAKEAVGHGPFGAWLEQHFPNISHRSANVYMKLAANKDKLDPPTNSQRAAILANSGEMSVRQALKEIRTQRKRRKPRKGQLAQLRKPQIGKLTEPQPPHMPSRRPPHQSKNCCLTVMQTKCSLF